MSIYSEVVAVLEKCSEEFRSQPEGIVQESEPVRCFELHDAIAAPVVFFEDVERNVVPGLIHCEHHTDS